MPTKTLSKYALSSLATIFLAGYASPSRSAEVPKEISGQLEMFIDEFLFSDEIIETAVQHTERSGYEVKPEELALVQSGTDAGVKTRLIADAYERVKDLYQISSNELYNEMISGFWLSLASQNQINDSAFLSAMRLFQRSVILNGAYAGFEARQLKQQLEVEATKHLKDLAYKVERAAHDIYESLPGGSQIFIDLANGFYNVEQSLLVIEISPKIGLSVKEFALEWFHGLLRYAGINDKTMDAKDLLAITDALSAELEKVGSDLYIAAKELRSAIREQALPVQRKLTRRNLVRFFGTHAGIDGGYEIQALLKNRATPEIYATITDALLAATNERTGQFGTIAFGTLWEEVNPPEYTFEQMQEFMGSLQLNLQYKNKPIRWAAKNLQINFRKLEALEAGVSQD